MGVTVEAFYQGTWIGAAHGELDRGRWPAAGGGGHAHEARAAIGEAMSEKIEPALSAEEWAEINNDL
jgi:hypothetical protein